MEARVSEGMLTGRN